MKKIDAYAKYFGDALARSRIKSAELANAVGVDPSYVSQWKTNRRPIPADKAVAVAALLGINPADISEAYEKVAAASGPSPSSSLTRLTNHESQSERFDPRILAATHRALRELYDEELGLVYNIEEEPEQFLLAYELHSALDRKAPGADPIGIFRAAGLAKNRGAARDGRDDGDGATGLPDEGTHKGKVAGKVQRKKG